MIQSHKHENSVTFISQRGGKNDMAHTFELRSAESLTGKVIGLLDNADSSPFKSEVVVDLESKRFECKGIGPENK